MQCHLARHIGNDQGGTALSADPPRPSPPSGDCWLKITSCGVWEPTAMQSSCNAQPPHQRFIQHALMQACCRFPALGRPSTAQATNERAKGRPHRQIQRHDHSTSRAPPTVLQNLRVSQENRGTLTCRAVRAGQPPRSSAAWLWRLRRRLAAAAESMQSSPQASASSLKCAPGRGVHRRKPSCRA